MDAFSDPLASWQGPHVMLTGIPPYPMAPDDIHNNSSRTSSAQDPELVDRGCGGGSGELSSIYQTAHHYEISGLVKECDRFFTKPSLQPIYNFGNDDGQVLGVVGCSNPAPPSTVSNTTAAALSGCNLELQHSDDGSDGLLHRYNYGAAPPHAMAAAQEDVTELVSSLGRCSNSPGARMSGQAGNALVELRGERVYDPSAAIEESSYYGVQLFRSSTSYSFGPTDMLRAPAKDAVQTHALYPCLVSAHVDCCKIGAEPAEVKSMEDAHLKYQNLLPRSNSRHSTETNHELDIVMAWYLRMLVDLKQKIEEPFLTEMEWCNDMLEKVKLLGPPPSSPMEMSGCSGDGPSNTSGKDGYTSTLGETMQQSYGTSFDKKNGIIEQLKQGKVLKEWLRSKHDRSEIFNLRGQCKKKRRQGKHPPTARECLVDWFNCHGDWPYPSEEEKLILAEQTKLEARQINNWFINQRKRHWDNTVKEETAEHELKSYRQIGTGEKVVIDTFYVPLDVSSTLLTMGASLDPPLLPKLSPT